VKSVLDELNLHAFVKKKTGTDQNRSEEAPVKITGKGEAVGGAADTALEDNKNYKN
jgi:hypothetical protein